MDLSKHRATLSLAPSIAGSAHSSDGLDLSDGLPPLRRIEPRPIDEERESGAPHRGPFHAAMLLRRLNAVTEDLRLNPPRPSFDDHLLPEELTPQVQLLDAMAPVVAELTGQLAEKVVVSAFDFLGFGTSHAVAERGPAATLLRAPVTAPGERPPEAPEATVGTAAPLMQRLPRRLGTLAAGGAAAMFMREVTGLRNELIHRGAPPEKQLRVLAERFLEGMRDVADARVKADEALQVMDEELVGDLIAAHRAAANAGHDWFGPNHVLKASASDPIETFFKPRIDAALFAALRPLSDNDDAAAAARNSMAELAATCHDTTREQLTDRVVEAHGRAGQSAFVCLHGAPGAGQRTLARKLAEATHRPVVRAESIGDFLSPAFNDRLVSAALEHGRSDLAVHVDDARFESAAAGEIEAMLAKVHRDGNMFCSLRGIERSIDVFAVIAVSDEFREHEVFKTPGSHHGQAAHRFKFVEVLAGPQQRVEVIDAACSGLFDQAMAEADEYARRMLGEKDIGEIDAGRRLARQTARTVRQCVEQLRPWIQTLADVAQISPDEIRDVVGSLWMQLDRSMKPGQSPSDRDLVAMKGFVAQDVERRIVDPFAAVAFAARVHEFQGDPVRRVPPRG